MLNHAAQLVERVVERVEVPAIAAEPVAVRRPPVWRRAAWMAAAVGIGALLAGVGVWLLARPAPPAVVHMTVTTYGSAALTLSSADRDVAITLYGPRVVYRGNNQLLVRAVTRRRWIRFPTMGPFLLSLLVSLRDAVRPRAALQAEVLALRHQCVRANFHLFVHFVNRVTSGQGGRRSSTWIFSSESDGDDQVPCAHDVINASAVSPLIRLLAGCGNGRRSRATPSSLFMGLL